MFLREFFMPVTVVAFLVTFGKYFSANWFGIFMPTVVGLEVLLFAFTGGVKVGELADLTKSSSAPQPNKDLLAARQRNAAQAEQSAQQVDGEPKKSPANAKQEKANAKKAAQAEKAAATAAKKTK